MLRSNPMRIKSLFIFICLFEPASKVLPESGEFVLTNGATVKPLVNPKKGFARAAKLAGIPWLQIHDMRRFRAANGPSATSPFQPSRSYSGTKASRPPSAT